MKIIMEGYCPRCGRQVRRPYPAGHGVCKCTNPPTLVRLKKQYILKIKDKITLNRTVAEEKAEALMKIKILKAKESTTVAQT